MYAKTDVYVLLIWNIAIKAAKMSTTKNSILKNEFWYVMSEVSF